MIMTGNPFPHYGPFVMGIKRSSVKSPHREQVMHSFDVSLRHEQPLYPNAAMENI